MVSNVGFYSPRRSGASRASTTRHQLHSGQQRWEQRGSFPLNNTHVSLQQASPARLVENSFCHMILLGDAPVKCMHERYSENLHHHYCDLPRGRVQPSVSKISAQRSPHYRWLFFSVTSKDDRKCRHRVARHHVPLGHKDA